VGSERRDRFLKLERPRTGDSGRPDPLADDGRFEGLGDSPATPPPTIPEPPARSSVPPSSTDRFRPAVERPLETEDRSRGGQPFVRCASCQMDNTVYATACQNCGAELDTPAQRAFNEKFWAERQAQAEEERRELADREARRQAMAAEEARQRRELAEEMARREKDRIDGEFPDGPFGQGPVARPGRDTAGMRLLRMIPGTGLRIAAAVFAIGVPLLLLLFGRGQIQLAGMMLLGLVIALFSPARRRYRRW
jgi:hypothetical protein